VAAPDPTLRVNRTSFHLSSLASGVLAAQHSQTVGLGTQADAAKSRLFAADISVELCAGRIHGRRDVPDYKGSTNSGEVGKIGIEALIAHNRG
jgi:hypothetical protein